MGLGTGILNNAWAEQRENNARRDNYYYNEMAANAADKRTRALYEDYYSANAQLNQLRQAGLSPSVFFGGQGASGMSSSPSGAAGAGANGISPNMHFIDPLTAAQIDNIKADTRKKNAETDTEIGTNDRGAAEIENILKVNKLTAAETAFRESQKLAQDIDNDINEQTAHWQVETIRNKTQIAFNQAQEVYYAWQNAELNLRLNEETFQTQVNKAQAELDLLITEEKLAQSNINLNKQQIATLKQEAQKMYYDMVLAYHHYYLDAKKLNLEIKECKNKWHAWTKEFNLELHKTGHEISQDYLDSILDFTQFSVMNAGNKSLHEPTPPPNKSTKTTNYNSKGKVKGYQTKH